MTSSTALERLKDDLAEGADCSVATVYVQDLRTVLELAEAAVLYRGAVRCDNADGHYKAHLGERYLEFVQALDRLTLTTADQGENK